MKNLIIAIITGCTLYLSACSFGGLTTNGESYTTTYNLPGTRISPYNDPALDNKTIDSSQIKVCIGEPDRKGFKCE
jgi:hypothetical protein